MNVGYGKPPRSTRFKKGRSGNPAGRPKGTKNLKTDLREELGERISLREGERSIKISKQRALIKALLAKAIRGDTKAASTILKIISQLLSGEEDVERPLTAEENEILKTFEQRYSRKSIAQRRFKRTRLIR